MPATNWEFEEAIECFRVVESCLKCIYAGDRHMYRPLAGQLRILLCDSPRPLLERLFKNLELQRFSAVKSYAPGTFPPELAHLNGIRSTFSRQIAISCMPFEAIKYADGTEDCVPLLAPDGGMLNIESWTNQILSMHPVPVTVRQVIKTVADRGGGAHVHKLKDALLAGLHQESPTTLPLAALVLIAISKVMQYLGHSVVQMYERDGLKGKLPFHEFDRDHPFVKASACVSQETKSQLSFRFNLLSIGPAEA